MAPHRWYPVVGSKVYDGCSVFKREDACSPKQRISAPLTHRGKRAFELVRPLHRDTLQRQAQCRGRILQLLKDQHIGSVGRIVEHRQAGSPGNNTFKEFQALSAQLGADAGQSRDVPARSRQVLNEFGANCVRNARENDGDRARRLLRGQRRWRCWSDDNILLQPDQVCRETGQLPDPPACKAILDRDVLLFDVTELTQPLSESIDLRRAAWRAVKQETDTRDFRRLLRACPPRAGQSADKPCDDHPPPHSITSSARSRMAGGISSCIALAVLRFTSSSKCVGCSTGISLGRAPLRILSTYHAARALTRSRFGPYDMRPPASAKALCSYTAGNPLAAAKLTTRSRAASKVGGYMQGISG